MKAPAFAYAKPTCLKDVYRLLNAHRDRARILAGGQSLMPALNMRLAAPELLIDITGLDSLRGITRIGDHVRIGALTRHCEVERCAAVATALPLLAAAIPHIAHAAIRNSGTFGGSIAYADPAAEIPAVAVALDAVIIAASSGGERRIAAHDFFRGLYETALAPDEIVLAVEFPIDGGYRSVFAENARRRGDYATVGLAAHARVTGGICEDVRLVFFAVAGCPQRATQAEKALIGQAFGADGLEHAVEALAQDLDPLPDLYHSRETKLELTRVLLRRSLPELLR
jgi:carbon-monoxide dehydrogenase medium subunit